MCLFQNMGSLFAGTLRNWVADKNTSFQNSLKNQEINELISEEKIELHEIYSVRRFSFFPVPLVGVEI